MSLHDLELVRLTGGVAVVQGIAHHHVTAYVSERMRRMSVASACVCNRVPCVGCKRVVVLLCCVQMFMGSGMSEDQAAVMATQMKRMSPGMMKFVTQAAGVVQSGVRAAQQARQWMASRTMLVLAVAVLLVAILLRIFGIM